MTSTNNGDDNLEIWKAANPSLYPGHTPKVPFEPWEPPAELTVGELVAELLKLDQGAKVYRHDSEYGPEAITAVEVQPAQTYGGYPAGRVYEFPEMIVIS